MGKAEHSKPLRIPSFVIVLADVAHMERFMQQQTTLFVTVFGGYGEGGLS